MPRPYRPMRRVRPMRRIFRTVLAVLAVFCLAGAWGCQTGKTGTAGGRDPAAPAAAPVSAQPASSGARVASPAVSGQELLALAKPFLDCAYAAFVSAQAGRKEYQAEAALAACASCNTLLEPFREVVFARTGNADYVAELTGVVQEHAVSVMQQASAAAR